MENNKLRRLRFLQNRQQRLKVIADRLSKYDQRFFWYRLSTFMAAWIAAILARIFLPGAVWIWSFLFFIIAFFVVVFFHRCLDRSRLRFQNALQYTDDQIARMQLDWAAIKPAENLQVKADHPYAYDLNIVGENSLFRLVDNCNTTGGRTLLLSRLLEPSLNLEEIFKWQRLIREMTSRPGFRYGLAQQETPEKNKDSMVWDGQKLLDWLEKSANTGSFKVILILLSVLAVITWILFLLNMTGALPAVWQFSLILYAAVYLFKHQDYKSTFEDAYSLGKSLNQFKTTLLFLETYPYAADSELAMLTKPLLQTGNRPSSYLRKIVWITSAASLKNNQILWLLVNLLLPWDLLFATVLNRYKLSLRQKLPLWLDIWYQLDALNAFANFAYLNPDYTFPVIHENQYKDQAILDAVQLGHPLIKDQVKVTNNFSMQKAGEVVLITGSNMSGKSTFLRTMGVNLALAYAGAPVNAECLDLRLLRLFTCIQVADSLADGFSYFYAEVHRLKTLLDLMQSNSTIPVFYLIDEIFRGTNNRERRIGSRAYVRALANSAGVGIISTHDLELANLASESSSIRNYNFRDDVIEGKMVFDYSLRPGPSPTTNALKIMELEGLPVDPEDPDSWE